MINPTHQYVTQSRKVANILNEFYVSVFIKEDNQVISQQIIDCTYPKFEERTIKLYIDKLNTHKAIGVDNVHPKFLKFCSEQCTLAVNKTKNKHACKNIF